MAAFPEFVILPPELQHTVLGKRKDLILPFTKLSKQANLLVDDLYLQTFGDKPITIAEVANYIKTKPTNFAFVIGKNSIFTNDNYQISIFTDDKSRIISTTIDYAQDSDLNLNISPLELIQRYLGPIELPITINTFGSSTIYNNINYYDAWLYIVSKKQLASVPIKLDLQIFKAPDNFKNIFNFDNAKNPNRATDLLDFDLVSTYKIYRQRFGCMVRDSNYAKSKTLAKLTNVYKNYKSNNNIYVLIYTYNILYVEAMLNKFNKLKFQQFDDLIVLINTDLLVDYYHTNPTKYEIQIGAMREQIEDWYKQCLQMINKL